MVRYIFSFLFIFIVILFSFSSATLAACKINSSGVVTGASCSIPKNESLIQENKSSRKTKINLQKSKDTKKRMNFKFDRSLLYRNVNVIWFN